MGKKKSVVLMTLLTIVMVVLCAVMAFPSILIGVERWNPAVMQFDLGTDLGGEYLKGHVGGGYYAYYYPEGVIPATEYTEEDYADDEYGYAQIGGLYVSKNPDDLIYLENGQPSSDYQDELKGAINAITARYEAKGYETFSVSVIDGYAIRVEVPASQASKSVEGSAAASQAISAFASTGKMTFQIGGTLVSQMDEEVTADKLVKSIKVKTQYDNSYIELKFTSLGKEMLNDYINSSSDSESGTSSTLDLMIGDEAVISIPKVTEGNFEVDGDGGLVKYYLSVKADGHTVDTTAILLNSALKEGGFDVTFTVSDVRYSAPVYQANSLYFVFGGVLLAIVALIVAAIVKMGGFGVVNAYSTVSYTLIVTFCYAFISQGVFPVTMGSVLMFLLGLVLVNAFNYKVFKDIKAEAALGKTVESAVKSGYKKNLMPMVDTYALLALGALAFLIGAGGVATVAAQALITVVAGAFLSLLWNRVLNVLLLSASKDKYKYFKMVREDDDDE